MDQLRGILKVTSIIKVLAATARVKRYNGARTEDKSKLLTSNCLENNCRFRSQLKESGRQGNKHLIISTERMWTEAWKRTKISPPVTYFTSLRKPLILLVPNSLSPYASLFIHFLNLIPWVFLWIRSDCVSINSNSPSLLFQCRHYRYPAFLRIPHFSLSLSSFLAFRRMKIIFLPFSVSICQLHDVPSSLLTNGVVMFLKEKLVFKIWPKMGKGLNVYIQ